MLPPDRTETVGPGAGDLSGEDRGDPHGAGGLDDLLGPLQEHEQRAGDVVIGDRDDLVHESLMISNGRSPGRATAMPSAIVGRVSTSSG